MLTIKKWSLVYCFFKLIWLRKTTIVILLLVSFCLGFFARLGYHQFIYLQAQNISGLSVFNEVILPLAGLTLACQILISLLVSAQLTPSFYIAGQASLLHQTSLKSEKIVLSLFLPVMLFGLWPLINFSCISFLIVLYSNIDLSRLCLILLGLFLINGISSLIILTVCLKAKSFLSALLQSILVIGLLLVLESSFSYFQMNGASGFGWRGIFQPFFGLREGLFVYADILSYLAWFILSFSLCYLVQCRKLKEKNKLVPIFMIVAFLTLFSAGFVTGQIDLSNNQRSSISSELILQLNKQQPKLKIIAVIDKQTNRDEIMRGFSIIQQVLPDSQIIFQSFQSLGPKFKGSGEHLKFIMGGLNQTISYPFEQEVKHVFESTIQQMLNRKQQWITFVEGHDEASIFANKTSDLAGFYQTLKDMGWPVVSQNLMTVPLISDNTGLLVIASSKNNWLASEENIVLDYLSNGGHLLLLVDPDSVIPSRLESFLGISRYPGTLIDWNGYQSGTPHPAVVIVTAMSQHPIVKNINSYLAFPWASGLKITSNMEDPDIFFEAVISSHKNLWNELNIGGEQLVFEPEKGELQQPFVLVMSRYNVKNRQKIIVIGDSHFVSDSAINNYANKQFGLNIIDWLNNDGASVYADSQETSNASNKTYQDNYIIPSRLGHFLLNWLFSLLFPVVIFCLWLFILLRRNQQFKIL